MDVLGILEILDILEFFEILEIWEILEIMEFIRFMELWNEIIILLLNCFRHHRTFFHWVSWQSRQRNSCGINVNQNLFKILLAVPLNNRVARWAYFKPNNSNLAFFKVVWPKNYCLAFFTKFGFFWLFLKVVWPTNYFLLNLAFFWPFF